MALMTAQSEARPTPESPTLIPVASLAELREKTRKVVKVGNKQIVLFHGEKGVFACNNRCPHEGFPLVEGTVADGCILTCNWHNWKFDLEGGETLVGGDRLRRYPVVIEDDQILLDVGDPPPAERAAAALESLRDSFRRHEYDRMGREIARLMSAGSDPLEAVRGALHWTHDRFEFGTTHAIAAAPDWLVLRDRLAESDSGKLVPLLEIVGHLAWDSLREPAYPFPEAVSTFDADALVTAIEDEDEVEATALVRGALRDGLGWADLEPPLARAALAHYADFGHSAIYVLKTGQLLAALGPSVAEPLLLALVRSLIYATREDLIPEFKAYGPALEAWDGNGTAKVAPADFSGQSVKVALSRAVDASSDPNGLYSALFGAGAWNFLHFDIDVQDRTDGPVSNNVGWLDFTHAITFGNAVRNLAGRYPELWPQGLLQMACFVGRNAGFLDLKVREEDWAVDNPTAFVESAQARLFDHGEFEYIVACHHVKTLMAAREEIAAAPNAPWVATLLAALNRFSQSPLKRKHASRTAHQALSFVSAEGWD